MNTIVFVTCRGKILPPMELLANARNPAFILVFEMTQLSHR